MERVSTYGLGQSLMASSMALQSRYAGTVGKQASGLTADTYGALGAKASTLISLESYATRMNTWSDTTQTALSRVQSMYSAVGDMADQMTSLRTTLSGALSSDGGDVDLNAMGKAMLADLADLMNLRQDGRYLFAGSRTDTAPVDVSALAVPTIPSTADAGYYTGDTETASVRVSDQQTIDYGVTANGDAFEKALRAANMLANLTTSPMDETAVTEAYDLATEALDGLLAQQGGLSINASRLETAKTRQDSQISALESMTSDIKSVDAAEIAVRVTEYSSQLQASYSALGKIGELSLTKYL
jgi:flagellar hook-associated protein 3 FlgL